MLTYGARSPIGSKSCRHPHASRTLTSIPNPKARQEKLLQGLMTEIVRMTSQMQPLEVGVPLYPFSHAGVFAKGTMAPDPTAAPLPDSTQYPDGAADSPTVMAGLTGNITSASSPSSLASWTSPTIRSRPYSHSVSTGFPQ